MCPLVLSAIYDFSKKWIYYFSSFTALIATIIMGYMGTWDNAKEIGRTSIYNVDEMYKEDEKRVEIEMKGEPVVNSTEKNQNEVLGPQNEVKPTLQGEVLVEKKEESVEKKEVAANQTEVTAAPQNEVLAPQEASAAQSEIPVTATVSA